MGSTGAGGGKTAAAAAPSSILMKVWPELRNVNGGSWHGCSGGGVKAKLGTGSGSNGEQRAGASLTVVGGFVVE